MILNCRKYSYGTGFRSISEFATEITRLFKRNNIQTEVKFD